MSEPVRSDFDAQLDRALRAIAHKDARPVDLHARVMAAIETHPPPHLRRGHGGWSVFGSGGGLWARPAFGAAMAVLLAVAIATLWLGVRHERRGLVADRGTPSAGTTAPKHASDTSVRPPGTHAAAPAVTASATAPVSIKRVAVQRRHAPEPVGLPLPRLEPPAPIDLEPIDAPPMQVASLHIERLSIDALEIDQLDRSGKE